MNKTANRFLSMMLALVMSFTCLPNTSYSVYAEEETGQEEEILETEENTSEEENITEEEPAEAEEADELIIEAEDEQTFSLLKQPKAVSFTEEKYVVEWETDFQPVKAAVFQIEMEQEWSEEIGEYDEPFRILSDEETENGSFELEADDKSHYRLVIWYGEEEDAFIFSDDIDLKIELTQEVSDGTEEQNLQEIEIIEAEQTEIEPAVEETPETEEPSVEIEKPESDEPEDTGTKGNNYYFTVQPKGGSIAPEGSLTLSWSTNFTPVSVRIGRLETQSSFFSSNTIMYTDKLIESGLKASMSAPITYNEAISSARYVVRAYWSNNSNDYVDSSEFEITKTAHGFSIVPKGGNIVPEGALSLSWSTNFTPVEVKIGRLETVEVGIFNWNTVFYSDKTVTSGLSRSMTSSLTYNEADRSSRYVVRAYWSSNSNDFVESSEFEITKTAHTFNTVPAGGNIIPEGSLSLSWSTNFTPVEVKIGRLETVETGIFRWETYFRTDKTITDSLTRNMTRSIKYDETKESSRYVIRAYWSSDSNDFIESSEFSITKTAHSFETQPVGGNIPIDSGSRTISWSTNFTPVEVQIGHFTVVSTGLFSSEKVFRSDKTVTSGLNRTMSASLTYDEATASSSCVVRAYWSDKKDDYTQSSTFTITKDDRIFTLQPSTVNVMTNGSGPVSWRVNFRTSSCEIGYYLTFNHFVPVYTVTGQDANSSFTKFIEYADAVPLSSWVIRAYNASGSTYVESDPFSVVPDSVITLDETFRQRPDGSRSLTWALPSNINIQRMEYMMTGDNEITVQKYLSNTAVRICPKWTGDDKAYTSWLKIYDTSGRIYYSTPTHVFCEAPGVILDNDENHYYFKPGEYAYIHPTPNYDYSRFEVWASDVNGNNYRRIEWSRVAQSSYRIDYTWDEVVRFRAYYGPGETDYHQNVVYIHHIKPEFTSKPASEYTVPTGGTARATWSLNFTPIRIEVCEDSATGSHTTLWNMSGDATSVYLYPNDHEYLIDAYYLDIGGEERFVSSLWFRVTEVTPEFTVQPRGGFADPRTGELYSEWKVNFIPERFDVVRKSGGRATIVESFTANGQTGSYPFKVDLSPETDSYTYAVRACYLRGRTMLYVESNEFEVLNPYPVILTLDYSSAGIYAESNKEYTLCRGQSAKKLFTGGLPSGVSRNGAYEILGWYTDSSFSNAYTGNEILMEDTTIYAKTTPTMFTVTYESNGGDSVEPVTLAYGSTIPQPAITRYAYSFGGWYMNAELTVPVNSRNRFGQSNAVVKSDRIIYARWIPIGAEINEENFPDPALRSYVQSRFDTDQNGYLYQDEAEAVTLININGSSGAVTGSSSLKGIELFPNLTNLQFRARNLTSADLSIVPQLTFLAIDGNALSELDLSCLPNLEQLWVQNNQLTSLDLSVCPNLTKAYVYNNPDLTALTVGPNLRYLYALGIGTKTVDVTENTVLREAVKLGAKTGTAFGGGTCKYYSINSSYYGAGRIEVDEDAEAVRDCPSVTAYNFLDIGFREYVAAHFDRNHNGYLSPDEIALVTDINITEDDGQISSLAGIKLFTSLQSLKVNGVGLSSSFGVPESCTSVDVSNNEMTSAAWLYNSWVKSINVSNNPYMRYLYLSENTEYISCYGTSLAYLNLSNTPYLATAYLEAEPVQYTDADTGEDYLYYEKTINGVKYILETDLSVNVRLPKAVRIDAVNFPDDDFRGYVAANFDTEPDGWLFEDEIGAAVSIVMEEEYDLHNVTGIGYLTELETLIIDSNPNLLGMDLRRNTKLTHLEIWNNGLTDLNIEGLTGLKVLSVDGNQLTNLDVSEMTLRELYVYGNPLNSLTLGEQPELKTLHAHNTQLNSLELRECPLLEQTVLNGTRQVTEIYTEYKISSTEGWLRVNPETAIVLSEGIPVDQEHFPDESFRQYVSANIDTNANGWLNETEIQDVTEMELSTDDDTMTSLQGIEYFTALEYLSVGNKVNLTAVDLSSNTALTVVEFYDCGLVDINFDGLDQLESLFIARNAMSNLDVSNLNLTELYCDGNYLHTLTLGSQPDLYNLSCYGNDLKELDISKCPKLVDAVQNGTKTEGTESGIDYVEYMLNGGIDGYLKADRTTNLPAGQPTSISIDQSEIIMIAGEVKQLHIIYSPEGTYDEIEWSSSNSSIAAVDSNGLVKAVKAGTATITATTSNGLTATAEVTVEEGYYIYSHSLNLQGKVGVNFFIYSPADMDTKTKAVVTFNNTTTEKLLSGYPRYYADAEKTVKLRVITVDVAAAQLRDTISIKLVNTETSETVALYSDGEAAQNNVHEYRALDYMNYMRSTTDKESLKTLVNALDNYGKYAQYVFSYNTDNLDSEPDGNAIKDITAETLKPYEMVPEGSITGLRHKKNSLALDSDTSFRVYFETEEGHAVSEYMFYIDGTKAAVRGNASAGYAIMVGNIPSALLDTEHEFEAMPKEGTGSIRMTGSALSYLYDVVSSENSTEAQKNVAKALYNYNQAANAYFGK